MKRYGLLSIEGTEEARRVMNVTLGKGKADLALTDATILNTYTGEWMEGHSVSVKGEWIAYVGSDPGDTIGHDTHVIDAQGKTILPGFIDGHTHLIDQFSTVDEFLRYAMIGGTTTIITESMEAFPVMGYEGVIDFLESLRDQPIKIFATAPAMVSTSKKAQGIPKGTLKKLLSRDDVLGLGESYWQTVLREPDVYFPLFKETLRFGKRLEGHSAGAKGSKLMAYSASGISSCHEPINADEVLERLRLGMHVMIREGSIRGDLDSITTIREAGIDFRRLMLATDGVSPGDLIEKGYMERVVQRAIDCGFDPIHAVQMATINTAEYFALDGIVGGIAPGKHADMVMIPSPREIAAEYVISKGQIIAKDGELLVPPRTHGFREKSRDSVHLKRRLQASDFSIRVKDAPKDVKVRAIDLVTDLVTKELIVPVPVVDGEIRTDSSRDILKVAAIDRRFSPGKTFVGLIRGFGLRTGAIASSKAWDTSDIIVVGENNADMALAVNRISELKGGAVVCAKGEIMAEIPLPVFGIISDLPIEMLARKMEEIRSAMKELGYPFEDPLLTLNTLTGAAIPFLRICEEGLVNLKGGETVGLIVQ
ncbi:MAG: adenine deaminase [Deltaproteobacteria bacterium]|nr:adenine deaminase [Deltaproteobacteria bacterium]